MTTVNESIRQLQRGHAVAQKSSTLVAHLAQTTGVAEPDVAKVLEALGLSRVMPEALKLNEGQEPHASTARIAFKLGRTTVVM